MKFRLKKDDAIIYYFLDQGGLHESDNTREIRNIIKIFYYYYDVLASTSSRL